MTLHPGRLAGGRASVAAALVFREVPKAACTTLAQMLFHADHGQFHDGDIHAAAAGAIAWPDPAFDSVLAQPERFVFAAVRNPYARLLATYFDKIRTPQRDGRPYRGNLRAILADHYGADLDPSADPRPGFRRFVLFVRDTLRGRDRFWYDRHWTPQAQHLRAFAVNGVAFDHLFAVEHWADGIAPVLARIPPARRPDTLPRWNASVRPDLPAASFFDDLTLHLVHEIYRWDFELFGYAAFAPDRMGPVHARDLAAVNARLADPHPPHWACLGG